jgi:hypothetical protein
MYKYLISLDWHKMIDNTYVFFPVTNKNLAEKKNKESVQISQ